MSKEIFWKVLLLYLRHILTNLCKGTNTTEVIDSKKGLIHWPLVISYHIPQYKLLAKDPALTEF